MMNSQPRNKSLLGKVHRIKRLKRMAKKIQGQKKKPMPLYGKRKQQRKNGSGLKEKGQMHRKRKKERPSQNGITPYLNKWLLL